MREYTVRFWSDDGDLFAFSEEFATKPRLERKYLHRMEVLNDDTVTTLSECHGPPEAVEEALGAADRVIDVMATGGETTFYYAHFEPCGHSRQMMMTRRNTSIALQMPLELRPDGSIVGSYVGKQSDLSGTLDQLPDSVEAELLHVRSDVQVGDNVTAALTERQREICSVALDVGYYQTPRTATQADVAAELDVSTATVGEHLRKIEAHVLGSLDL